MPEDEGASVSILLNGSAVVASGTSATWDIGSNNLVITVTNGNATKTYTVEVTKNE